MTSIFPVSASVGQEFSGYNFDGESWNLIGNEFNPTSFSSSPPLNPKAGDLWVDSSSDVPSISPESILTKNSASTIYLSQVSASSTYITQTSASSSFALRNGPAFSAWNSTATAIPAGSTVKIGFQTEEFDTNNNFDTTLSRFTPTVAGYYQINALITLVLASSGAVFTPFLFKNGSEFKFGGTALSSPINFPRANISVLVYANGTTDYFEIFSGHSMGTSIDTGASQSQTFFQAAYVRGA
jgi:hypothetical protein